MSENQKEKEREKEREEVERKKNLCKNERDKESFVFKSVNDYTYVK